MFYTDKIFINELDNAIAMTVVESEDGLTVHANGPTSSVDHTWTPIEATTLHALLGEWLVEKNKEEPI